MTWISTKDELSELILPRDTRYYASGYSRGPALEAEQDKITKDVFQFLKSDVLRVASRTIPDSLPERLPKAILAGRQDLSVEEHQRLFEFLNDPSRAQWCRHDPEGGYLMAKLLAHMYAAALTRGWSIEREPWYSGFRADGGLLNPQKQCVIAIEIGDINPHKLLDPFFRRGFGQLWHWPYYGWPSDRTYDWQQNEIYWIWRRGRRWGKPLQVGEPTEMTARSA